MCMYIYIYREKEKVEKSNVHNWWILKDIPVELHLPINTQIQPYLSFNVSIEHTMFQILYIQLSFYPYNSSLKTFCHQLLVKAQRTEVSPEAWVYLSLLCKFLSLMLSSCPGQCLMLFLPCFHSSLRRPLLLYLSCDTVIMFLNTCILLLLTFNLTRSLTHGRHPIINKSRKEYVHTTPGSALKCTLEWMVDT